MDCGSDAISSDRLAFSCAPCINDQIDWPLLAASPAPSAASSGVHFVVGGLAFEQCANGRRAVGFLFVGLAPGATKSAEVVRHQIDIAIDGFGDDRG